MASKQMEITDEMYEEALTRSWEVELNIVETFPKPIFDWVQFKATEQGVPFAYVAFPLLSAVAYIMGKSYAQVSAGYEEPVIIYSLVAGRSGTNKTGCLALISNLVRNVLKKNNNGDGRRTGIFDSGTMDGLLTNLRENNECVFAAVDEFCMFLDSLDNKSNGNGERGRYLTLWSGKPWSKITKTFGLEEVENPRFQFTSFLQNYFLIDLVVNTKQYDGFLPRYLMATPDEVYTPLLEKLDAQPAEEAIDMDDVFSLIYENVFERGLKIPLSSDALKLFADFHDNYVLAKRRAERFEDKKTMVLSKSIGNVLRISAIQAVLREACKGEEGFNEKINAKEIENKLTIEKEDMSNALSLVKYSINCVFALIDSLKPPKRGVKRPSTASQACTSIPDSNVIDKEFLLVHRQKIQKLFSYPEKSIPFPVITKNHMYPQIGNKNGSIHARNFMKGLEKFGLGELVKEGATKKEVFNLVDIENANTSCLSLLTELGIIDK